MGRPLQGRFRADTILYKDTPFLSVPRRGAKPKGRQLVGLNGSSAPTRLASASCQSRKTGSSGIAFSALRSALANGAGQAWEWQESLRAANESGRIFDLWR